MTADYPVDEVPATPEYVLEVIRDWHRIAVAAGEADSVTLSFDTPIPDWEDALCIETWGRDGFGAAMNAQWDIDIPAAEWRAFQPISRNLGDLCRLIASLATRPVIRPWKHVAGECSPAGAFLTLRAMLAGAGEDPKHLTPSTPLDQYLTRRYDSLWLQLPRLVPGCGPLPAYTPLGRLIGRGVAMSAFVSLLGVCFLPVIGIPVLLVSVIGLVLTNRFLGFWEFPNSDIRTFRDLAYALAGQRPRRRIQPSA
jgi:hypothetical protein